MEDWYVTVYVTNTQKVEFIKVARASRTAIRAEIEKTIGELRSFRLATDKETAVVEVK